MDFFPFRAAPPAEQVIRELGSLADLSGVWMGNGFSLISLPDRKSDTGFRLKLNATKELLVFEPIGAPIPDRGSADEDIEFKGLHYFQQISDIVTSEALHLETGMWLNLPPTEHPKQECTIVRLSNIPHGNSLIAQGEGIKFIDKEDRKPPVIHPVDSTPFTIDPLTGDRQNISDTQYLYQFLYPDAPPNNLPAGSIANPNLVLVRDLEELAAGKKRKNQSKKEITTTALLKVSATPIADIATGSRVRPPKRDTPRGATGGILNIPFLIENADAVAFEATLWIESVKDKSPKADGDTNNEDAGGKVLASKEFVQLQYSQVAILDFDDIKWPHITVATLVQQ